MINGKFLFNPWQIKEWKDEQIAEQVEKLVEIYDPNADTMYTIANDVEIISDIQYLYGEMISRLGDQAAKKRLANNIKENKSLVKVRNDWSAENPKEKAPAIDYFKAKAADLNKEDREEQIDLESDLSRFKYAYDSMEQKMNALKKKLESIKFEEFNR